MEEVEVEVEQKKDNGKMHLIGVSLMVLTAAVVFNAVLNVFAISERREIMRQIDQIHKENVEAKIDREAIKSKLYSDLSELKALSVRQHQEPK